jgi:hypothetical protein
VCVPVLAARNGLAGPFVLAGGTGTASGMHARRVQTLQCVHPNADDITACLRERSSELSDACRQVIQVDVTQITGAGNGTRKRKRKQNRTDRKMFSP